MASLRELKTCWQVRYYDSARSPTETTDSLPKRDYTRAEAEAEADWRQQLYDRRKYDPWSEEAPGLGARPERITVMEAARAYVQKKREMGRRGQAGGWTEKTMAGDAPVVEAFADMVGPSTLIHKIRRGHIADYVYQEHLAEATQAGYWRRIVAMLRWWHQEGWLEEMPRLPAKPRTRRKVKEVLSPEDLKSIFAGLDRVEARKRRGKHTPARQVGRAWCKDVWQVCFWQGLRRSEAMQLRARNVDLAERRLRVGDPDLVPKGKDEQIIPIVEEALPTIQRWLQRATSPSDRLFQHAGDKVSRAFREAVDAAALDLEEAEGWDPADDPEGQPAPRLAPHRAAEIDFYTLRHSCATYWLRHGRSLVWVKRLMRHKAVDTTMQYVHLVPEDLLEM